MTNGSIEAAYLSRSVHTDVTAGTTTYVVSFAGGMQPTDNIEVWVNGIEAAAATVTWLSDSTLQLNGYTPVEGDDIEFRRVSPKDDNLVDLEAGKTIRAVSLMKNFRHVLQVAQEAWDRSYAGSVAAEAAAEAAAYAAEAAISADIIEPTKFAYNVDSVEALRLTPATEYTTVYLRGHTSVGDGGHGTFRWDAASTAADDNGVTIAVTGVATGRWIRQLTMFVTPEMFGAVGDGVTDDTTNIQSALLYAASVKIGVVASKNYNVEHIYIPQYVKFLKGSGTIKTSLTTADAPNFGVVNVYGSFHGAYPGLDSCIIEDITIDCNGGAKRGIFASSLTNSTMRNITVRNLGTNENSAIRLNYDCLYNRIYKNRLELPTIINKNTQTCYGVHIVSYSEAYGGWATGAIIPATNQCKYNRVIANIISNGSHGVSLTGSDYNSIVDNTIINSAHRNIHLINSSYNSILSNSLQEAWSAGVLMAYGSNFNKVSNNRIHSTYVGGEAGIEAYVACADNTISDNKIRTAANYGVYLAIDAIRNKIIGNDIEAGYVNYAAIAVESDWESPLPADFLFSRPNYGAPPSPRTAWPNSYTGENIIKDNVIHRVKSGKCAIYFSQLNAFENKENAIDNNYIDETYPNWSYYFVEETLGKLVTNSITNNVCKARTLSKQYATRGRGHFSSCQGNNTFNGKEYYPAADGDTSPSAFYSDNISTAGYSSPTSITDFDDGMDGQRINVRLSVNTTIVYNSAYIRTKGGVNIVGTSSSHFVTFERISGIWFEMFRNF